MGVAKCQIVFLIYRLDGFFRRLLSMKAQVFNTLRRAEGRGLRPGHQPHVQANPQKSREHVYPVA
jgi:hypothetical protein